jgi:hypothetical protein
MRTQTQSVKSMSSNGEIIAPGQLWISLHTGNRWRVLAVNGKRARVRRLGDNPDLTYSWVEGAFTGCRLVPQRPCPACGKPHDPTYIPPPRVPLSTPCACCCQQ